MADTDGDGNTPKMSLEEHQNYRALLRNELSELEFAQAMVPSEYKQRRINILKKRLDIPVE